MNTIKDITTQIRDKKFFILVDDLSTTYSSYIVKVAEDTTSEDVSYILNNAKGVILCSVPEKIAKEIDLLPLSRNESTSFRFGPSIEARLGVHSGISSEDRAKTICALAKSASDSKILITKDLVSPGHVFPVISKLGGLLVNFGIAEAITDLLSLEDTTTIGLFSHIITNTGEVADSPATEVLSKKLSIPLINISVVLKYRLISESIVKEEASTILPTKEFGTFSVKAFRSTHDGAEHLALLKNNIKIDSNIPTLVRMHSERVLGDLLIDDGSHSRAKLLNALQEISKANTGALVYIRKGNQNISFNTINMEVNKIENLKELGVGAQILKQLGISKVTVLSNSDKTFPDLSPFNIEILGRQQLKDTYE